LAQATLSFYLQQTSWILRDSNFVFTPKPQLTTYINEARRQVAYRTGCLRCLIQGQSAWGVAAQPGSAIAGAMIPGQLPNPLPSSNNPGMNTVVNTFATIQGVELYPFSYANPYLQGQYAGVKSVIDVIDLAVSWGGIRPVISWLPFEDLQAYARSYNVNVTSYPFFWSTTGDGENQNVWIFPNAVNSGVSSGEFEWDTFCVPIDLYQDSDYEAIPGGFQNAVKYYAAGLAYLSTQRFGMARLMLDQFDNTLGISRVASDRGKTRDYYAPFNQI